ncbi:exocyst complex component exo70 [Microbotryomycetes sp. JL221]|nr:exocyst complex component exo70 [Microbotryomycetes sp. JL221]
MYSTRASANSAAALEQSNADLTLLTQSLAKSRRITDQMTTRLSDFDDRLARLEKSLVPIHKQTGRLTRVSKNLELTLRSIEGLLGHQDLVEKEQGLIKTGPKSNDLTSYYAALDRLTSAAEALRKTNAEGQSDTLAHMARSRQLVLVFAKWTKGTSPQIDAGALYDQGKPFPTLSPTYIEQALPLIAYLRALPEVGPSVFKELQTTYADTRAAFVEEALRNCGKEVLLDASPSLSASPDRRGLGRFLDVLLSLAKSELALLGTIFSNVSSSTKRDIYALIVPPSLALLFATGQQLNTMIKKNLRSLIPIAFSTFSELQERTTEYDDSIRTKAGRKDNELGELLHALRGTCLTSLPEFIDDAKARGSAPNNWGAKPPPSFEASSAGISQTTVDVVNFMRVLCDNQPIVEGFLGVLGPGNWGGPPSRSPAASRDEEDSGLLPQYLNDVLSTLLTALDSRARSMRSKSGVASIFLLNNVSYIRREVLSSHVGDLLGEQCEDSLNKKMRSTKASYLEIWSPLVSAMLDAGLDQSGAAGAIKAGIGAVKGVGTERRELKDRFLRFNDAFAEVEALHNVAKIDEGEAELRERLKGEVERMVLPTYTKFLAKHRNGEFSKNPSKYLKMDADQLQSAISTLFE